MPDSSLEVGGSASEHRARILKTTDDSVQIVAELNGYSPDGLEEYHKAAREYLIALDRLSTAKAKLKNSDTVGSYHVRVAVDMLNTGKSDWLSHVNDIGILLVGAGLGYLGIVIFGSSYTFKNAMIAFMPLLIGCIMYAYASGRQKS